MIIATSLEEVSSETCQVLRTAADHIRELGWWQGGPVGPDGQLCVAAAIGGAAAEITQGWPREARIAERVFREIVGEDSDSFNDTPGRTKEEVLAALEKAAELAEGT